LFESRQIGISNDKKLLEIKGSYAYEKTRMMLHDTAILLSDIPYRKRKPCSCQNGGQCDAQGQCLCRVGYNGDRCEVRVNRPHQPTGKTICHPNHYHYVVFSSSENRIFQWYQPLAVVRITNKFGMMSRQLQEEKGSMGKLQFRLR